MLWTKYDGKSSNEITQLFTTIVNTLFYLKVIVY